MIELPDIVEREKSTVHMRDLRHVMVKKQCKYLRSPFHRGSNNIKNSL